MPGLAPEVVVPAGHAAEMENDPTKPFVDGTVNEAELLDWVQLARRGAEAVKRLSVCDAQIGQVLAYGPADSDGKWPCRAVRKCLEVLESPEMERALALEIMNRRGFHCVGRTGDAERALGRWYNTMADRVDSESPRTAAVLRIVGSRYMGEAKRVDKDGLEREFFHQ
jgi:hypothetical protein